MYVRAKPYRGLKGTIGGAMKIWVRIKDEIRDDQISIKDEIRDDQIRYDQDDHIIRRGLSCVGC